MSKIPTLYSDYQECILDLDIYGKIVSTPQQSIEELTNALFEEFKRRKPMPTLEYKRYELSRLVNPDYRIAYNKELELQDNESLVELRNSQSSYENINFEDLSPLIPEVQEAFSYEMNITDSVRQSIIEKYDLETGEEFKPGIRQTENIVGTVEEDTSLRLSDESIEKLGVDDEEETALNINESYEPNELNDDEEEEFNYDSYSDEEEDVDDDSDEEDVGDYDSYASDDEEDVDDDSNEDEEEEFDYDSYSDEEEDVDDYDSYSSDDDSDEDDIDDYDSYSSDDDEEEEINESESEDEEEIDESESEDEEEIDDYDSYSSDDEEDEEDVDDYDSYSSDDEEEVDDYSSYEQDDDNEEEVDDYSSYEQDDDNEEEVDDYSSYEQDDDNEEEVDDYSSYEQDDMNDNNLDTIENVGNQSQSTSQSGVEDSTFIDSVLDEPDFSPYEEPVVQVRVQTPVTPAQIHNDVSQPEVVDRSAEPTDIRAFLRKHPRCEYNFALKYFTKKQINDAIKIGKIIKKGNILKII